MIKNFYISLYKFWFLYFVDFSRIRNVYIRLYKYYSKSISTNRTRGVCINATTKIRDVILDFNMVSEIITFEDKGKFGKEKHQNLGVKVKVVADMVSGNT